MKKWGNSYWEGDDHPHHVSLYASAYHSNEVVCLGVSSPESGQVKKKCQHSQRMFLTAKAIHHGLVTGKKSWDVANNYLSVEPSIHHTYCIGQWKKLMKQVLYQNWTDAILVWEHSEILDMIEHLGVNNLHREKAEAGYGDMYNLVLYYDTIPKKVGYECFGEPRVACEQVGSLLLFGLDATINDGSFLYGHVVSLPETYAIVALLTVCFFLYVSMYFAGANRDRWRRQQGYISI